jgi:branched-chain amino acid transport system ATP-binding protein
MLLSVNNLYSGYNKTQVLFDVSLNIKEGEIIALIGHNGAGKSTLLKSIIGLIKPDQGSISYQNKEITFDSTATRLDYGIFHAPQEDYVFKELSVLDNLELSFFTFRDKSSFSGRLEEVYQYFPILKDRYNQRAGTLSGGERRALGIAMGLLRHPKVLLLDEASNGLSPLIFQEVLRVVRDYNTRMGTAIIIVEQNVKAAFEISNRVYVMKSGRIVMEEKSEKLLKRDEWWDLF